MKLLSKKWLIAIIAAGLLIIVGGIYVGKLVVKDEYISGEDIRDQLEKMYEGKVDDRMLIKNGVYIAEMTQSDGKYTVEVDAANGSVLSITQTSKIEVEEPKTAESKEPKEQKENPEEPKVLSEQEVKKLIAKNYEEEIESIKLNKNEKTPIYEIEAVKNQAIVNIKMDAVTGKVLSEKPEETTSKAAIVSGDEAIKIAFTQLKGTVESVEFEQTNDGGYYIVEIEQDNGDDEIEAEIHVHAVTGKILFVDFDD